MGHTIEPFTLLAIRSLETIPTCFAVQSQTSVSMKRPKKANEKLYKRFKVSITKGALDVWSLGMGQASGRSNIPVRKFVA